MNIEQHRDKNINCMNCLRCEVKVINDNMEIYCRFKNRYIYLIEVEECEGYFNTTK